MFTLDNNLNQTLQKAKDTIEDVIKDITSKNDISSAQLEHLSKAVCIVEKLNSIELQDNYYSANSYKHNNSRRYNDFNGYSGHSIKDRMISNLEKMFDETHSEHEQQLIQEWIDRLASF